MGSITMSSGASGKLLFYSNWCVVFDKSHQLMMNGDSLNPGTIRDEFCEKYLTSYPHVRRMISIPNPDDENIYHIIHTSLRDSGDTISIADTLRITSINQKLNNGNRAVVSKNEIFFIKRIEEQINACKHQNKKEWWIITHLHRQNTYVKFLLTGNGISQTDTQSIIGNAPNSWGYQGCFSPVGSLYAWFGGYNDLHLFDFDIATG